MLSQIVVKAEVFITIQIEVPDGADAAIGVKQTIESLDLSFTEDSLGELVETHIPNWEIVTTTNLE